MAFDETDDFAHGGRYSDYLNSAHYTDDFLRKLLDWVQHKIRYTRTKRLYLLLVITEKAKALPNGKIMEVIQLILIRLGL